MRYFITLLLSNTIALYAFTQIDADFTADTVKGCDKLTVKFTDNSTGNVLAYNWEFGDPGSGVNNFSTLKNPTHTYSAPGVYTVKLTVFDNIITNTETKTAFITVLKTPTAAFSIGSVQGCVVPITVNFTNTTSGTGLTYSWDFGDSNTSTQTSPSHIFTTDNTYNVKLTANNNGCTHTANQNVKIETFKTDFTVDTVQTCVGKNIFFTDKSTVSANQWNWTFGDGTTSTSKNPTKSYSTAGTYSVKLISKNTISGCSDSITKSTFIMVHDNPTVDFTVLDDTLCSIPVNVNFTSNTVGAISWDWTFENGQVSSAQNPSTTFDTAGSYNISLTVMDAKGCTNVATKNDFIHVILPEAGFAVLDSNGCKPFSAEFIDTSKSPYPITNWEWDFQNNGSVDLTTQNPTFVYTDTGAYTVSLIITNSKGCKDTAVTFGYIEVGQPAIIDFIPKDTTNCHKFTVPFTDLSSSYSDQWFWNFGDGGTSTLKNPTHTYADTGYFSVSLYTKFHDCPSDTLVIDSVVHVLPSKPIFSASKIISCDDTLTVTFTDASQGATSWDWKFGDGAIASGPGPHTHFYASTGFYTAELVTKNSSNGCADSITQLIQISDGVPNFTSDTVAGCQPLAIEFYDKSIMDPAFLVTVQSVKWLFGNGNTSTSLDTAKHTYQNPGFYDVTLVVTDNIGCIDTIVKPNYIEVKQLPVAGFFTDTTNGCAPLTINFTDTSSGSATLETWIWKYGDSSPNDTVQNASHIYSSGKYPVSWTVIDTFNCSQTVTKSNLINATFPKPAFTVDNLLCNNTPVAITNSSTGANITSIWNYGDNSPIDTVVTPNYVYQAPKGTTVTYEIKLLVVDSNGCTDSLKKSVDISSPKADFTIDTTFTICPDLTVQISNASTSSVETWLYSFGDGVIYQGDPLQPSPPAHTYLDTGYYDVYLIVIDSLLKGGCSDTLYKDSLIRITGPVGSFTTTSLPTSCDRSFQFNATSPDADSLIWDFGDGTTALGSDVTHYYPNTGGSFLTKLTMKSNLGKGCTIELDTLITISSSILVPNMSVSNTTTETDTPINFTNTSTTQNTIVSSDWYFSDGDSVINANTTSYQFLTPGDYTVMLVVKDNDGCIDTAFTTISVTEKILEYPTVFSPNGDGVNDVFRIPNNGTTSNRLTIFNRWGQKIFDNTAKEIEWYGVNFSGTNVSEGTYYFVVESIKLTGENITQTGYITLLR